MNNRLTILAAFLITASAIFDGAVEGAEVRLKASARCKTGVVLLGDIADVFTAETWQTEQLRAIELGPAPSTGGRRFIKAREVQDALWMRGINLSTHQISGADRIEVTGPGETVTVDKPIYRPSTTQRERAEKTA